MMKNYLLILHIFACSVCYSQNLPFCIEKSSVNNYAGLADTSINLYKSVRQNSKGKLLLFTVRTTANSREIYASASVGSNGDIYWAKALRMLDANYRITQIDALSLSNQTNFIFAIAEPDIETDPLIIITILMDEAGNLVRQKNYSIESNPGIPGDQDSHTRLAETDDGNIIFYTGLRADDGRSISLAGNIQPDGTIAWIRSFRASIGEYAPLDVLSFGSSIILQGISRKPSYPFNTIINSTKLNLYDGSIISSISHNDHSDMGTGVMNSSMSVLQSDHTIKTMVSWRIPEHNQLYFSFTQDTSFNLLRSTTFYTPTNVVSYLPVSAALNNRGYGLIKTVSTNNTANIGFVITGKNDEIIRDKRIASPWTGNFGSWGISEIVFDDKDSIYTYWNSRQGSKSFVGWIKTGLNNPADFCTVKDSSFTITSFYPMNRIGMELANAGYANLINSELQIELSPVTITRELICDQITGFCDPIKMASPDTVCSISAPIRVTINKNPECRGPVNFSFDKTLVANWEQPDDTTLLLYFNTSREMKIIATSSFCPDAKDSVLLVVSAPLPGIDLGEDRSICKGDSVRLFAEGDFKSYVWDNGHTGPDLIVKTTGRYSVTVKDKCDRSYSDTISINVIDKKSDLGADRSICKKESVTLAVKGNFTEYSWQPAYNLNQTNLKTVIAFPEVTTRYDIRAISEEGCITRDTIVVYVKDCPQTFFIPTAFTPNNDGKNDGFRPIITAPLEKYKFSIYNRWGQMIFYSIDKSKGWNGKLEGVEQNAGVFTWVCEYKFFEKEMILAKGTFVLIR